MITKKYKPTTPGRRGMISTDYSGLSKTEPFKKLLIRLKNKAGRGHGGRITMRHQGGGEKALYRIIDFKQNKIGVPGRVESIEYDPYRTAFIALVVYSDGERRYIIAPEGLKVESQILTSEDAPFVPGMRTTLKRIPVGTFIHNVETNPGRGGSLARSAGSSLQILANEDGYTHLKMPSGEIRKVLWSCLASIGQVSNPGHNLIVIGKAGRSRQMGIRPTVRASAMNPRDHKYGGGEGRAKRGTKRPKDKWGNITGGRKTRKRKKWSNKLIIKRRK
ncbi:MAG: 50S ribosomal protein L2 [Candidatus Jorgensenbacteria bacterium]